MAGASFAIRLRGWGLWSWHDRFCLWFDRGSRIGIGVDVVLVRLELVGNRSRRCGGVGHGAEVGRWGVKTELQGWSVLLAVEYGEMRYL